MLGREKVSFYIGFDPTADSLHVGHFVALMAMAHMQRAGHKPIVLLGGGTGMIGDPSGKTDMRKMMTTEMIDHNVAQFRKQIGKFLDFSQDKPNGAVMVDNGDWLRPLNYIDFLREVGAHFSVNRMLTAECYKRRMEKGLTFLEFNYMLMQAYDFLELNRRYGCKLEMGGDDQWSNILAGRGSHPPQGTKGSLWPDLQAALEERRQEDGQDGEAARSGWIRKRRARMNSIQYWRNVDDADVKNCLALLTFLPMDEVERLGSLQDAKINEAKERLAFEITRQVHGEEEATKAMAAARALFAGGGEDAAMPTTTLSQVELEENKLLLDLLVKTGLTKSRRRGAAPHSGRRRLGQREQS